jgi:nucleotide-binding universal stress UspA family protein
VVIALSRTTTEALMIGAAVWLAIGLTLALLMARRGHSAFQWFIVGSVLGPLSLPLAMSAIREERPLTRDLIQGVSGGGRIDVLVGVDGSSESEAALRSAVDLLGGAIGRLTLASVITFDNDSTQARENAARAAQGLAATATATTGHEPGTVLLSGQPGEALVEHANNEGYGLLVVGRRGKGASKVLLGSTAVRVANASEIPVLII